jgi:hypothetical protein
MRKLELLIPLLHLRQPPLLNLVLHRFLLMFVLLSSPLMPRFTSNKADCDNNLADFLVQMMIKALPPEILESVSEDESMISTLVVPLLDSMVVLRLLTR